MLRRIVLFGLSFLCGLALNAQYKVPAKMDFAGVELHLNHAAQEEIQGYVNALVKSEVYHQRFVDLANMYFPIIEPIFKEKGLPNDFKYLIIQESAFKSDAVSSSNAVGYWQMKKPTAQELGLRVDNVMDERKNIVASTKGAATYIIKNNRKLDNWLYALLSYNMGPTGVQSEVKEKDLGASKMSITNGTHWYIKKCLAHKIAFEKDLYQSNPPMSLILEWNCAGKSVKSFLKQYDVDQENLMNYNKWIAYNKTIPSDKKYAVIIPVPFNGPVAQQSTSPIIEPGMVAAKNPKPIEGTAMHVYSGPTTNIEYSINNVPVIVAKKNDTPSKLANIGGISTSQFLRYNEMKKYEKVQEGYSYYLKQKKRKAMVVFHVVQGGETIHSVAQEYGIRKSALRFKNKLAKGEALQPGRLLWLRKVRPVTTPVEFRLEKEEVPVPAVVPVVEEKEVVVIEAEPIAAKDTVEVVEEVAPVVVPVVAVETEPAPVKESKGNVHIVAAGETLYSISKQYGITVDEIIAYNQLDNQSLSLGQKLIVGGADVKEPVKEEESKEEVATVKTHVVQPGETLYGLARDYEVEVTDIKAWNNLESNALSVGQEIIIKQ